MEFQVNFTCSIRSDGAQFDGEWISRLLEVEEGVVVATGAVKVPAAAHDFPVRQVHPEILLEVADFTPPATGTDTQHSNNMMPHDRRLDPENRSFVAWIFSLPFCFPTLF